MALQVAYSSNGKHARADRPLPVRYLPQLDALRALAVLAVWIEHWGIKWLPVFRWFNWGLLGVRLFFVLSGFLITGILLRARDEAELAVPLNPGDRSWIWATARNFYSRRFLRILPIYYLTLLIVPVFALGGPRIFRAIRPVLPWHLTYTTNFYWFLHGEPQAGGGGHFWTLAVEEQFYLVWPWLILLVPRRYVLRAIVGAIGAAVLFRVGCGLTGHLGTIGMLPLACLDQFALGGALAVLGESANGRAAWRKLRTVCLLVGAPLMVASLALSAMRRFEAVTFVTSGISTAAVFTWLVGGAAEGFSGLTRSVLESRPVVYLGRISYGLYIYHPFVGAWVIALALKQGWMLPDDVWVRFAVFGGATVLVATVSWYVIERPISNFKRYFAYLPPGVGKPELAPVRIDPATALHARADISPAGR